jgi:hypothetical protein
MKKLFGYLLFIAGLGLFVPIGNYRYEIPFWIWFTAVALVSYGLYLIITTEIDKTKDEIQKAYYAFFEKFGVGRTSLEYLIKELEEVKMREKEQEEKQKERWKEFEGKLERLEIEFREELEDLWKVFGKRIKEINKKEDKVK